MKINKCSDLIKRMMNTIKGFLKTKHGKKTNELETMKIDRYSSYSDTTKKMMETIEDFLKAKNGKIYKKWEVGLITLADSIEKLTHANDTTVKTQPDGLMIKALDGYVALILIGK